jgi:phage terminase large subunit
LKIDIDATGVFEDNHKALYSNKRFVVNQGGSRSSKTYSLCQLFILHCLTHPNERVSIVRKTLPALRNTVMVDFFEILQNMDIYNKESHNKTNNTYNFPNGSQIAFFSTDDEQKLRGRKHSIVWANEANELLAEEYLQLNMRCEGKFFVDFNPSENTSWIYELPKEETITIKSTYKDNPFLPQSIINQIEDLKRTDEALYQIYALGERAVSKSNIYSGWSFIKQKPERFQDYVYGLDFGYNHPSALVRVYWCEKDIYIEPVVYESYLTTTDLIERFKAFGIESHKDILADYSRPEIIAEMQIAGYNVNNANKEVKNGINNVKTFKVYCKEDENLKKEYDNYKWKKVKDTITDEPIKLHDDAMDAIRYAVQYIKEQYFSDSAYISF